MLQCCESYRQEQSIVLGQVRSRASRASPALEGNVISPRTRARLAILVAIAVLSGCATRSKLVSLEDGTTATRTEGGVTVTLTGSVWQGEPWWLEEYVTPVYAVVENGGETPIRFGYDDLVIFDEQRVQYSALAPETVATRIQSAASAAVPLPPSPPPPFWHDPLWPWWYDPWWYSRSYAPPRPTDIFAQALPVGIVRPYARVQGSIYFTRLPATIQRITISIGYERSGELGRREVSFPFRVKN